MSDSTQQTPPPVILGPPERIDAATRAFCAAISAHEPVYVPVAPAAHSKVAYCFDNSVAQAQAEGGEAVYGWAIWHWPGRWFEAEHHAVWRRPDGSLLDVTPQLGDQTRILFLPDPDAVYNPGTYRRNVMAPDAGNPLAAEYIALAGQRNDITDRYWYPGIETFPLFSAEDQAELRPIDARMIALRREMMADEPADPSQRFADMVRQPGHPLNPAWQTLSGEITTGEKARNDDIRYLLRLVRRRYPGLEALFEEEHVLRWERRGQIAVWTFAGLGVALVILAGFLVASAVSRLPRRTAQVPPAPPVSYPGSGALTNQLVDTDRALQMLFADAISLGDLEDRNPALAQTLQRIWNQAHDRGDGGQSFVLAVARAIDEHYRAAVRSAPAPVVIEYYSITLDGAQALRKHSAEDCLGFATGGLYDGSLIPPEIAARNQKLTAQVLLNPALAPPETGNPQLTPAIVQAAAARASLTLPAFGEALQGKGSAESQCAAHVALWETLIAMPPAEGAALLRRL